MKILDLVLKHKWYDMIDVGDKPEEYRQNNDYWNNRLIDKETLRVKPFSHVRFHRGYTSTTMLWTITDISLGRGKTEWGAPADKDVFIIKLGSRL